MHTLRVWLLTFFSIVGSFSVAIGEGSDSNIDSNSVLIPNTQISNSSNIQSVEGSLQNLAYNISARSQIDNDPFACCSGFTLILGPYEPELPLMGSARIVPFNENTAIARINPSSGNVTFLGLNEVADSSVSVSFKLLSINSRFNISNVNAVNADSFDHFVIESAVNEHDEYLVLSWRVPDIKTVPYKQDMGPILNPGASESDLYFYYSSIGNNDRLGIIQVIPEPKSSVIFMTALGALVLTFRHRQAISS